MKYIIRRVGKWLGISLASLSVILIAASLLLNSGFVQNRLARVATRLLSERLGTNVVLEETDFSFRKAYICLHGVCIEDQQGQPMLEIGELAVRAKLLPMFHKEFDIRRASISDLRLRMTLPTDSTPANYQFLIDSLQSKQPRKDNKANLQLNVKKVDLRRIEVLLGDSRFGFSALNAQIQSQEQLQASMKGAYAEWKGKTRRGPMDCKANIETLKLKVEEGEYRLSIANARYLTDNHKPRRNVVKPKRGFFDTGHLDILANMKLTATYLSQDSVSLQVQELSACDSVTGIDLHDVHFAVQANRHTARVTQLALVQGKTNLAFETADIQLPNKEGAVLRYSTSPISATVYLKDIARPFTPVLRTFVMPLSLTARMEGEGDQMRFRDVHVWTNDKALDIRAVGGIEHLRDKQKRLVHFDILPMRTTGKKAMKIIDQLAIKKFMLKQLEALGHITYRGRMDIRRKREHFRGAVQTDVGGFDLNLTIDGWDRWVLGTVRTDSLKLGQVVNMPALGKIACTADFKFDISKERTARMRKRVGGKLPMGEVKAHVTQASFRKIKVHNLGADINSNGALAVGNIAVYGRRADLLCTFTFTNTDSIHKMKIKPGVRFHKLSEDAKQAKAEKKQQRAEKRQQKAEQRRQQKMAKDSTEQKQTRKERRRERKRKKSESSDEI